MTESECRDADVSMQQYAQDQRNLQGGRISASPELGDYKVSLVEADACCSTTVY
jgi:hypothetical protein